MHFKIEMNCKTAKWEVFLEQYLFWRKIKGTSMQFDSYDDALAKCVESGLDKAYVQKNYIRHSASNSQFNNQG